MTEPIKVEPSPSPIESPKKGINLKIVIPIVILVVIMGAFGYSYVKTSADLQTAADSTYKTMGLDYRISNLSLFPPSADMIVLFNLNNPSAYDLDITVEFTMFYDETVLVPIKGSISLPAGKSGVLECSPFHLGSETVSKMNEKGKITTSATIVATTKVWGMFPVSYTKTATDLKSLS